MGLAIFLITGVIAFIMFIMAVLTDNIGWWLGFVLTLLIGYGIVGVVVPIEKVTTKIPALYYCSEELGECRIHLEKDFVFDTDEYVLVNCLLDGVDSIYYTRQLNSYGYRVVGENLIEIKTWNQ